MSDTDQQRPGQGVVGSEKERRAQSKGLSVERWELHLFEKETTWSRNVFVSLKYNLLNKKVSGES